MTMDMQLITMTLSCLVYETISVLELYYFTVEMIRLVVKILIRLYKMLKFERGLVI